MTPEKQELKKLEDFFKLVGENGSADHQSDDEVLSKLLDETLSIWLYDAREDAKGWLSKWRSWDCRKERLLRPRYISPQMCHCSQNESYPCVSCPWLNFLRAGALPG